tara:strand:- start:6903 stop:7274 length:372 start_codon:yes stop_codon:yes gene_type:complete
MTRSVGGRDGDSMPIGKSGDLGLPDTTVGASMSTNPGSYKITAPFRFVNVKWRGKEPLYISFNSYHAGPPPALPITGELANMKGVEMAMDGVDFFRELDGSEDRIEIVSPAASGGVVVVSFWS